MPIYEYICFDCGTRFDVLRSMGEADAPIACKSCAGERTARQLAVLFATGGGSRTEGSVRASSGGGCAGCSGGACSSCGH